MGGGTNSAGASAPAPSVALGLLAAGVGFLLLPISDAIAKAMGIGGINPLQIGWGRWLAQVAIMAPLVIWFHGLRGFRPRAPMLQIGLGLTVAGATVMIFFGLRELPMPTVTSTLFVAPLIVVALSGILFGEKIGPWRWSAVIVGFGGVLLIVRPGSDVFLGGSVYPLGAAACLVGYIIFARMNAGKNPPMVTMFWMGVVGTLFMGVLMVPVYEPFTLADWGRIAIMGAVLTLGHGLIIWAADRVEASAMAPMPYMEMVTATVLGYLVFDELPGIAVWFGCVLVIGAGLFVAWRENRRGSDI